MHPHKSLNDCGIFASLGRVCIIDTAFVLFVLRKHNALKLRLFFLVLLPLLRL
jgi:hypothetical protein